MVDGYQPLFFTVDSAYWSGSMVENQRNELQPQPDSTRSQPRKTNSSKVALAGKVPRVSWRSRWCTAQRWEQGRERGVGNAVGNTVGNTMVSCVGFLCWFTVAKKPQQIVVLSHVDGTWRPCWSVGRSEFIVFAQQWGWSLSRTSTATKQVTVGPGAMIVVITISKSIFVCTDAFTSADYQRLLKFLALTIDNNIYNLSVTLW